MTAPEIYEAEALSPKKNRITRIVLEKLRETLY